MREAGKEGEIERERERERERGGEESRTALFGCVAAVQLSYNSLLAEKPPQ